MVASTGAMNDPTGHGTCVASIAYGVVGIMTEGTMVAVKATGENGEYRNEFIYYAIGWAIEDIYDKGRSGRSVINISLSKSTIYTMTFVYTKYGGL